MVSSSFGVEVLLGGAGVSHEVLVEGWTLEMLLRALGSPLGPSLRAVFAMFSTIHRSDSKAPKL